MYPGRFVPTFDQKVPKCANLSSKVGTDALMKEHTLQAVLCRRANLILKSKYMYILVYNMLYGKGWNIGTGWHKLLEAAPNAQRKEPR